MRQAGKVDLSQAEIVKRLRQIGASVQVLSGVGKGCPDLLVGWRGRNYLIEAKTGDGKRTAAQVEWAAKWAGQVAIARTAEEAQTKVIGAAGDK